MLLCNTVCFRAEPVNHHQNCHVCLFYESIETGWIETVCFTYIPKLNPVSDSKSKPVSTNGSRPKWNPPSFFRFRQRNRDRGWFHQIRESGFSFTCEAGGFTETETGTGFGFDKWITPLVGLIFQFPLLLVLFLNVSCSCKENSFIHLFTMKSR